VVGGTGLYIRALIDNLDIPKVAPNQELRKQLGKKKLPELAAILKKIDPAAAKKIDLQNPRRVLRALEVFILSEESFFVQSAKSDSIFDALEIGIDLPRPELYARIDARVDKQMEEGLFEETKKLAQQYDWQLPSMSGIGYRQMGIYLRREAALDEAADLLKRDTRRYAKRQMTWFRRDKKIKWLKKSDLKLAAALVKKFLAKSGFVS
jgi:tRNA dimethylallyltransferase